MSFFFLFLYILEFVGFLQENEYGRFIFFFQTHSLSIDSHPNYSDIVYFRSYQGISVSNGINAKCR